MILEGCKRPWQNEQYRPGKTGENGIEDDGDAGNEEEGVGAG